MNLKIENSARRCPGSKSELSKGCRRAWNYPVIAHPKHTGPGKPAETRLFDRDRSGVKVTPAGKEFLRRAEQVIQASEESDAMGRVVQVRRELCLSGWGR